MNSVILLIQRDTKGMYPINTIIKSFNDWDWAVLKCAQANQNKTALQYYFLEEILFEGNVEAYDLIIEREKGEISICIDDEKLYFDVNLEYYPEDSGTPDFRILSIKLCGTELDNLKISDDLKKKIRHEAENYRDEMIEELKNKD